MGKVGAPYTNAGLWVRLVLAAAVFAGASAAWRAHGERTGWMIAGGGAVAVALAGLLVDRAVRRRAHKRDAAGDAPAGDDPAA
jgi:hypothetical protein